MLSLSICIVTVGWSTQAFSQIPSLDGSSAIEVNLPPAGVSRYGALEVAWVRSPISGEDLFQVAAPTIVNRADLSGGQMPVEVRAQNIEDLLWLEITRFRETALMRLFNQFSAAEVPEPRSAQVIISTLRDLPVLQVANSASSRPLTIATVTPADVNFYSEKPEELAQLWKEALEEAIAEAEYVYSPVVFQQRLQQAAAIVLGILLITGLVWFLRWRIGKRQKALQAQYSAEVEASSKQTSAAPQADDIEQSRPSQSSPTPHEHRQLTRLFKQQFNLAHRLDIYKFVQWLLAWMIVLVWYLGIYFLTTRLPVLMQWSNSVLTQPLSLIAIWFLVSLVLRVSNFLIQRSINAWKENPYLTFGDAQRKVLRSRTIAGALQGLIACVLILLGILLTLVQFGLPVSSLLAGGAVVGLALSFGTQNLVKDLVNGCLILLEDQFAVGDVITTNGETGIVEELNLRLTRLRNVDGELISIPNSNISLVKNQTSIWSRVNLGIEVAYDTDLDRAIAIITEAAVQMSKDPDWQALILEPPEVLGVDGFGDNSITIRIWIRTEPLQQWRVGREFRLRLKKVFDKEGISIPFPQRSVWFENALLTQAEAEQTQPESKDLPVQNSRNHDERAKA